MEDLIEETNYQKINESKFRKEKSKFYKKDKAKKIIKDLDKEIKYINIFKQKEENPIEKKEFLNIYEFETIDKKIKRKGYINPLTNKMIEIDSNFSYNKFDRYKLIMASFSWQSIPKDFQEYQRIERLKIEYLYILGTIKNPFLKEINEFNNSEKTREHTEYNQKDFYKNNLITKSEKYKLISKAFNSGKKAQDVDGFSKHDKNKKRRRESKRLIEAEKKAI